MKKSKIFRTYVVEYKFPLPSKCPFFSGPLSNISHVAPTGGT
jgi:hypothetical protein